MKRKTLSLALVMIMLFSTLFVLTGCGDKEETKTSGNQSALGEDHAIGDNNSAESVINNYAIYYNNKDAKKIADLFDIEALQDYTNSDYTKEDVKKMFEEYFERYDYDEYKVIKITNFTEEVEKNRDKNELVKVEEKGSSNNADKSESNKDNNKQELKSEKKYQYYNAVVEIDGNRPPQYSFVLIEKNGKYSMVVSSELYTLILEKKYQR